jgi:DNA-directed RNA polymerase subunit RPC12/RpoP
MDARHCVSCGRSIDWDANICPYCGHDFRVVLHGPVRKTVSAGIRALLYVASFLVPIAGIIIGIVFMTRSSPDEKHVGKMCLLFSLLTIVVAVGFAAAVYIIALGIDTQEDHVTPYAALTRAAINDGYRFTFVGVAGEARWSDAPMLLTDGEGTVAWLPSSDHLEGTSPATVYFPSRELYPLVVTLSVTDLAANGEIDSGDSFTLTSSPVFGATAQYTVTIIYEPTGERMCEMTFSG